MLHNIAYFDIETAGVNAFNADLGWMISVSIVFDDQKTVYNKQICDFPLFKKEPHNDRELVKWFHAQVSQANYISGHYAEKFDRKFVNTRCLKAGLLPLAPVRLIDTWRIAKTHLKLSSNRLANLAKFLGCENQKLVKGEGWPTWWYAYLAGLVPSSIKSQMKLYNNLDVLTQRDCANKLKPFWPRGVFLNSRNGEECRHCQSNYLNKRGFFRTEQSIFQRIQCQDCGTWDRLLPGVSLSSPRKK